MAIMPQIATGSRKFRPDVKKSAQVQLSLQVHQHILMSPGRTGRNTHSSCLKQAQGGMMTSLPGVVAKGMAAKAIVCYAGTASMPAQASLTDSQPTLCQIVACALSTG